MKEYKNGSHYDDYRYWNKKLHNPYDYKHEGLNRHIMSHKLWNTQNPFLRTLLSYVESSLIYAMESAEILENFYNYNWKNR